MRYRLPDDCAGVTHAGLALARAADGTIEAEEASATALAPHGIVPAEGGDEVPRKRTKTVTDQARSNRTADDRRMLR